MSKELGEKLKEMRDCSGFTQQMIADKINVDRSTYSNYERSVTEPDVNTLKALAKVFGVTIGDLLSAEPLSRVDDTGKFPLYTLSKDEQEVILGYRVLSAENKRKAISYIRELKPKIIRK